MSTKYNRQDSSAMADKAKALLSDSSLTVEEKTRLRKAASRAKNMTVLLTALGEEANLTREQLMGVPHYAMLRLRGYTHDAICQKMDSDFVSLSGQINQTDTAVTGRQAEKELKIRALEEKLAAAELETASLKEKLGKLDQLSADMENLKKNTK